MIWALLTTALAAPPHDCFGDQPGPEPHVQLARGEGVGWFGPDCMLVGEEGLILPSPGEADQLVLSWVSFAPVGTRGAVADVIQRWENGHEERLVANLGSDIWQPWSLRTGDQAWSEWVGIGTQGKPVVITNLLLTTTGPAPLAEVEIRRRGPHPLAVVDLAVVQSPHPMTVQPASVSREDWYPFDLPWAPSLPGAVNLEAPAGQHGAVTRCGDHLCFADGTAARFWGINLVGASALPEVEDAPRLAQELAGAGFNLVRLHHLDAASGVSLLHPDRGSGGPMLDPMMVDRLDRLAAELLSRGVYLVLEGPTRRQYLAGEGIENPGGIPGGHKYVTFFEKDQEAAHRAWFKALYDRVNPYTGLSYTQEPGVAWFEMTNENSLVAGWLGGSLERLHRVHRRQLDALWNAWLEEKYKDDAHLMKAWSGGPHEGLEIGETLALASVARSPIQRSWTEDWPVQRVKDLYVFYAGLERAWYKRMRRWLREDLGIEAPLAGSILWGRPASDRLQQHQDLADLHVYWDPMVQRKHQRGDSAVSSPWTQRLPERVGWGIEGLPLVVSELNHPFPNPYAYEAPLIWAALGAVQGIDAVVWFAYSHEAFSQTPSGLGGIFDLRASSAFWSQAGVAGQLFLSGALDVPEAIAIRHLNRAAAVESLTVRPKNQDWGHGDLETALTHRLRTSYGHLEEPLPASPEPEAVRPNWEEGVLTVSTPNLEAVVGDFGTFDGVHVQIEVDRPAAIWVVSEDGEPLGEARSVLVVSTAGMEHSGQSWSSSGRRLLQWGGGPVLLEPVLGTVQLDMPCKAQMNALGPDGEPGKVFKTGTQGGAAVFELPGTSPWTRVECR